MTMKPAPENVPQPGGNQKCFMFFYQPTGFYQTAQNPSGPIESHELLSTKYSTHQFTYFIYILDYRHPQKSMNSLALPIDIIPNGKWLVHQHLFI